MFAESVKPKKRPAAEQLLADIGLDMFAAADNWEAAEPAWELLPDLTSAQESRLREALLLAAAQSLEAAPPADMPPLSTKNEQKFAKPLANPFRYARWRRLERWRPYVAAAALLLAICTSLFLPPATPTWASAASYVPVCERGVLKPYLLERYVDDKPATDCWQPPQVDLTERWFGGVFDDRFNK